MTDTITRYGISIGNAAKTWTNEQQKRALATITEIVGEGGYFRTDLSTQNTDGSFDSNLALYDQLAANITNAGLSWYPLIHMIKPGGGGSIVPLRNGTGGDATGSGGMQAWYDFVATALARYGSNISIIDVWNEPNTNTGNCGRQDDAFGTISNGFTGGGPFANLKMAYSDYAEILRSALLAIATASSPPTTCGFVVGRVDTTYIKGIVDWCAANGYTNPLTQLDAVACHIYPNTQPSEHTGDATTNPDTPVTGQATQPKPRTIATIQRLREYLDAATPSGTGPDIVLSEGGYSGSDTYNYYLGNVNRNDVLYATPKNAGANPDQATSNLAAIDKIQQNNAAWRVRGYVTFQVFDSLLLTPGGNTTEEEQAFYTQSLGHLFDTPNATWTSALPIGYWKAWPIVWAIRAARYGLVSIGSTTPAGQLRVYRSGGTKLTMTNTA